VTTRGHCETVNLRLDIDHLLCILFQPAHIDLDVEMANAAGWLSRTVCFNHVKTHLLTMASSGITSKCFAVMMSLFPVVVTKMFARGAASSMVVIS
jgi:hypothetical protein